MTHSPETFRQQLAAMSDADLDLLQQNDRELPAMQQDLIREEHRARSPRRRRELRERKRAAQAQLRDTTDATLQQLLETTVDAHQLLTVHAEIQRRAKAVKAKERAAKRQAEAQDPERPRLQRLAALDHAALMAWNPTGATNKELNVVIDALLQQRETQTTIINNKIFALRKYQSEHNIKTVQPRQPSQLRIVNSADQS